MNRPVLSLFNAYIGAYDEPIVARCDTKDDVVEAYRRLVLSDPETAYKNFAHEKTVCVVGYFDDMKGVIQATDSPEKLCDLAKFFPAGFIAKKIAQEGDVDA